MVVDLALFLPLVIAVAVLKHHAVATQDSYVYLASVVAVFLAPLLGGAVAGRRGADTPLMNGAAAAGAAFMAFLVVRVADGALNGRSIHAGQAILFLLITVSMGMVGASIGSRQAGSNATGRGKVEP
jgi:putative membrane protein (TIGR04086 family)